MACRRPLINEMPCTIAVKMLLEAAARAIFRDNCTCVVLY
jgi:hypothetical protein